MNIVSQTSEISWVLFSNGSEPSIRMSSKGKVVVINIGMEPVSSFWLYASRFWNLSTIDVSSHVHCIIGVHYRPVVTYSHSTIKSLSPSPASVMEIRNGFRVRKIVQKINVFVTKLKHEFLPVYFWPPNKHCGTYISPPQIQRNKTHKILKGEGFNSILWDEIPASWESLV